ncbi:MAG: DEAD/DEAH box helicase [Ktedonobacteraceae bacterium]
MPSFNDFSLLPTTRAVLASMKITEPTPIQVEAIPALLAGSDLVGQSATGSGKTLAYGIPLVEKVAQKERSVQALVLVPTRELAVQVSAVLSQLAANRRLSMALLVGGRPYGNQLSALRYGAQIVVGTPGRVKDHLERGSLVLSQLRICVLDEADQMLDSGFAPVIEDILTTTPDTRQMALFSATIPDWVEKLQKKFLKNPVNVAITLAMSGESTIEQIAYQVPQDQKIAALCTLLNSAKGESSLIFGRTKFGVERLGKQLSNLGFTVGTLHGNKSQRAREDVLAAFRRGHVQTLLATNVAARGLDIQGIYQVINYELPESSELFTHRIGRTGRMGRQGKAITLLAPSDLSKWRHMARNLGQAVVLQRLVIDVEAISTIQLALPQASVTQESEREQYGKRRLVSSRKQFLPVQEQEQNGERSRKPFSSAQDQEREQHLPVRSRKPFAPDQESEQQPVRSRKPFSSAQEQSRPAQPRRDTSYPVSDLPRPQQEQATRRTSTWQPEGSTSSERPYSSRVRDSSGRGAGKPSRFARTAGDRKAHPFTATESQPQPARRKPAAASAMRPRRANPAKRAARY